MLGSVRDFLYKAASALEKKGDLNYYYLGPELSLRRRRRLDLLLKILKAKSPDVRNKFEDLVTAASVEPDPVMFKISAAVSGAGVFRGVSTEGCDYLVEKAYRRGQSLQNMFELKEFLPTADQFFSPAFSPTTADYESADYEFAAKAEQSFSENFDD